MSHASGWEEKEKYHYIEEKKKKAKPDKRWSAKKILSILAPALSVFTINSNQANQISGSRGTRLTFAKDALVDATGRPYAGVIKIYLTEVIDPLDFIAVDLDLTYINPQGKLEYFQSAGMFKVEARTPSGEVLALAPGVRLSIEFPNIKSGEEFFVYRHDAQKKWQLHGHNQFSEGAGFRVGTRRYEIDELNTWYNFDKPVPEAACAKGSVVWAQGVAQTPFKVHSVGISYKGNFARYLSQGDGFRVNVHKSSLARFLVLDDAGRIGISEPISVWNKTGFDSAPETAANVCQDIGAIELGRVDETILADKRRLSEFLGLEVRDYQVDYGKPGDARP